MDKTSIRKQIDGIKKDFDSHIQNGEVPLHVQGTIKSLFQILEIILTVLLTKKTRKNSSNSGLPPSQGFGSNGNRNTRRNQKDEKLEPSRCDNVRDTESVETITPTECSGCGSDLREVSVLNTEERKEIDILYEIHERTVISESKQCPDCGQETIAAFPTGMDGPIQYGIGIKAAIINFLIFQMIPLQRVQDHFTGLIGKVISQSTMLKYISNLSKSLSDWEKHTIEQLLKASVMHVDETSMRVNKRLFTRICG